MAYKDGNGNTKYTLKEKIKYHTACSDTGINPNTGEKLSNTQRIRHANSATKCVNKLNRFMKTGSRYADMKSKRESGKNRNSSNF